MRWIISLFAISILLSTGCSPVEEVSGPSGIEGQVTLAECYGDQVAEDCFGHQPYQTTLQILDAGGTEIVQVETDEEGLFRIELPPGRYLLHPIQETVYPITVDWDVSVIENTFTHVDVVYDSGAR